MSDEFPDENNGKTTIADAKAAAVDMLLKQHDGHISPQMLVDAARDKSSFFHPYFCWDDAEAAEQFRLVQAGLLIRQWRGTIIRLQEGPTKVTVRSTRRVQSPAIERGGGNPSYQPVEDIMADPVKRADMISTVMSELRAYRRRYAELRELSHLWEAIDQIQTE